MAGAWLDAGLPRLPIRDGLGEQPQDYAIRFAPEQGPSLVRRGSTALRTLVTATYRVDGAQRQAFLDFWRSNRHGEFLWPDPFWRPDSGDADEIFARFEAPPSVTPLNANLFDVSVQLQVRR